MDGWMDGWMNELMNNIIVINIFLIGAAVTTYKRWEKTVPTYDENGQPNGHRRESGE